MKSISSIERDNMLAELLRGIERGWPRSEYSNLKRISYRALTPNVLAVAVVYVELRAWKCYIGAVSGENHEREMHQVHATGAKQPEDVARALFPSLSILQYER